MRLSEKEIGKIAGAILENLKTGEQAELCAKESEVLSIIKDAITKDAQAELALDREVKRLMEAYSRQIEKGEVDSRKIYGMIKSKLAKEKGIVL